MKDINIKIFMLAITSLIVFSCAVDDYDVANPPRTLDGPAGFLASGSLISDDAVTETDTGDDEWTYLTLGGSVTYTIDIVDAPGLIDSVSVRLSNSLRPDDFGSVAISIEGAKGQSSGTISVTYTAGSDPGEEDIEISIWDAQEEPKSDVQSFPTIKIVDTDCFPDQKKVVGFYDAVTSGFDGLNEVNYTGLEAEIEIYYRGDNHPGWVRFSDGSFGLYTFQDPNQGGNFINVELCGGNVISANEEFLTFTGTINEDGSMNISWANDIGDTGNTVLTPQAID